MFVPNYVILQYQRNINTYFSMPLLFITLSFSISLIYLSHTINEEYFCKVTIFSFLHTTLINFCEISTVTYNLGRREYSIMFWVYYCNVLHVQLFLVICFALQGMLLLI